VAIEGDTLVVGASDDDTGDGGADSGSVYIYTRSPGGTVWTLQYHLVASDGRPGDAFGNSVAISGDTIVVGAVGDDLTPGGTNAGSAYVFVRSGVVWTQQAKLTAADASVADFFGRSVSISSNTVLVGASNKSTTAGVQSGAAYVFTRAGTVWSQQARFIASDGATLDGFGFSVAVEGDTAIIAADTNNTAAGTQAGSVYVFTRAGSVWTERFQLFASDGLTAAFFGYSVALEGDTLVVGSPNRHPGPSTNVGGAYVFTRSGGLNGPWTERANLGPLVGIVGNDWFGRAVALSGDTVLIGSYLDDPPAGNNAGTAAVFTRTGGLTGAWSSRGQVKAADGAADDNFGAAVAIEGSTLIVGAPPDDTPAGVDAGSVYSLVLAICKADFNCSGTISVQDIFDFLAAYFAHLPNSDFNSSGTISVQDIFDFLAAYFTGC
jgi:hypothetical protein